MPNYFIGMEDFFEIWKDVVGYEGLYQVSNLGNKKSLTRGVKSKNNSTKIVNGRVLANYINSNGYIPFSLCKNGICCIKNVHVVVATAFIPNPDNLREVNHKNGVKSDNRVENLEWCTSSYNSLHAIKNGFQKVRKGEEHPFLGKFGSDFHRSKLVLNEKTGVFYETLKDAAYSIGMSRANLSRTIRGFHINNTGLKYV